jgi:predicted MPP superfamily phosphohydrolase
MVPPVLVEHDVAIGGLCMGHQGFRLAHLSDIHVGRVTTEEQVHSAVTLVNQAAPDLVVMTGDYVNHARREIPLMAEQLAGIRAPVLAILGNHDYYAGGKHVAAALTGNGYRVLRNQRVTLDVGGAPLHVIGVDDPVTRHHDLDAAFADIPEEGTRIVLCHTPGLAERIALRGAHLILSGHTHGGQIFIRGITDKIAAKIGLRYLSGFFNLGKAILFVTAGVGSSATRWRVGEGTRAEVAVLTLRAA